MQNKILQQIVGGMKKRYGDDITRKAFSAYGDDVAKKGAKSFLARELAGTNTAPKMVNYHGISQGKLSDAISKTDSYLVNPSMQSVDPAKNMGGDFGEIILLGDKSLANSANKSVSTYNRDIYSPRFPEVTEDGMIAGTNKFASADALSQHMNKQGLRGVEQGFNNLNPGSLAAKNSKRFTNVRDMVEHQDGILPYEQTHEQLDQFRDDMAKTVGDMADFISKDGSYYGMSEAEADLADMLKGHAPFYDYPQDVLDSAAALPKRAKKLPTDYFETKVTRPVHLNEFNGAILPQGFDDERILKALADNDIPILDEYGAMSGYNPETGQNTELQGALQRLTAKDRISTPYLLGLGGAALPTAGILGALLGGGDRQSYS